MEAGVGIERDFAWVGGHKMQCVDDVLLSCTPEKGMVLQTNAPI